MFVSVWIIQSLFCFYYAFLFNMFIYKGLFSCLFEISSGSQIPNLAGNKYLICVHQLTFWSILYIIMQILVQHIWDCVQSVKSVVKRQIHIWAGMLMLLKAINVFCLSVYQFISLYQYQFISVRVVNAKALKQVGLFFGKLKENTDFRQINGFSI